MSWTGIKHHEAHSGTGFLPNDGVPGNVLTIDEDGRLEWADPGVSDLSISAEAIEVSTAGAGLILTTPDGTKRYMIAIDNNGAVTSTLI